MSEKLIMQKEKMKIINIGIEIFASTLKEQGIDVVDVDWRPPAGGDVEMIRLLSKLENLGCDDSSERRKKSSKSKST